MNKQKNTEFVISEYEILKNSIKKHLNNENYEKVFAEISICSTLLYYWNQTYVDSFLEEALSKVAAATFNKKYFISDKSYTSNNNSILFYDGFGLDTRGLALIYVKALASTGYNIIYVTCSKARNNQPEIDRIIEANHNIKKIYYKNGSTYLNKLRQLQSIVTSYKIQNAFLYTTPYDSVGVTFFMQLKGYATRYQINLTDHAFWIGKDAFDYCIEFRNYGACVSAKYRNISQDKILILPYYPIINKNVPFEGFPFDYGNKKIIFSGGALYKTIDDTLTYYHIVESILTKNKNAVFLYAGSGNHEYIDKLALKFPNRVFFIQERKDLFLLMKHITIYLNTYPMIGGLMTQYAVVAGKIPLTLKHGNDGDGVLIDQRNRRIEYNSPQELVDDADKLLNDENYLKLREQKLKGGVISEQTFNSKLKKIIEDHDTDYKPIIFDIDTTEFRKEYINRFNKKTYIYNITNFSNRCLTLHYLNRYIKKFIWYFERKIGRRHASN